MRNNSTNTAIMEVLRNEGGQASAAQHTRRRLPGAQRALKIKTSITRARGVAVLAGVK